jgi:hypothetical protein
MEKEIEFLKFQETNSQNDYIPVILDGKTIYITWKMIGDAIKEKYGDYTDPETGRKLFDVVKNTIRESDLDYEKQLHKQIFDRMKSYGFTLLSENDGFFKYTFVSNKNTLTLYVSSNVISLYSESDGIDYKQPLAERYKIDKIEQLDFLLLNGRIGYLIERVK